MNKKQQNHKLGFTLLELLVVVLIIGILAAIALPKYQRVVERSKMAEAVTIVKTIAQAQQRFYMINNRYADCRDLEALDIDLGGSSDCRYPTDDSCICKQTDNFLYMASNSQGSVIAQSLRKPLYKYYIQIGKSNPNKISCGYSGFLNYQPTQIQKELCDRLRETGSL